MDISRRIAELETARDHKQAEVVQAVAALRGIEAELSSLRAGLPSAGNLQNLTRSDAILEVLRSRPGTASPLEVTKRLADAGRSDNRESVTATLDYLRKQGHVLRPSRGRYIAV